MMTEDEIVLSGLTTSAEFYESIRFKICICGHEGRMHFMRSDSINIKPYISNCAMCVKCYKFNNFELTIERMITDEI